MNYYPEVVQAIALSDYHIAVYFSDGHIKEYDMNPMIRKGGVFRSLEDKRIFNGRLTVMNGTAAWDLDGSRDETKCIDIDPFELYEGTEITDPLEDKTA